MKSMLVHIHMIYRALQKNSYSFQYLKYRKYCWFQTLSYFSHRTPSPPHSLLSVLPSTSSALFLARKVRRGPKEKPVSTQLQDLLGQPQQIPHILCREHIMVSIQPNCLKEHVVWRVCEDQVHQSLQSHTDSVQGFKLVLKSSVEYPTVILHRHL